MLTLNFYDPATGKTCQVGPVSSARLLGGLLQTAGGQEIACHQAWMWQLSQGSFPLITTDLPTLVRFEKGTGTGWDSYRSDAGITLADGGIWLGPGLTQFLAKFDESGQLWYVFPSNRRWPVVALVPG
jgi:hypothetical protein